VLGVGKLLSYSVSDLVARVMELVMRTPERAEKGVVKLQEGFAGKGNAIIDLSSVHRALLGNLNDSRLNDAALIALETMEFCCKEKTWDEYSKEVNRLLINVDRDYGGNCRAIH
jgi:hypothetical protein